MYYFIHYEAKLFDNCAGTTHGYRIEIILTNGDKITAAGGSQGFQTVSKGGKQFNIKGDKLWSYFGNNINSLIHNTTL
jgi:hypothetical protein